jgi:WD repeat-containing protein 48
MVRPFLRKHYGRLSYIYSRDQNWVASGSFDRTIKLWDLGRPTGHPLVTMNPPDAMAPKSSVYALTADPFGHVVASGSPERVVRLWDPRTGKRTGDY